MTNLATRFIVCLSFVLIVARFRDYAAFAGESFEECHCLPC